MMGVGSTQNSNTLDAIKQKKIMASSMPPKQDELRGIKPTRQAVQFEF